MKTNRLYLIGAGPGNPELLTLQAAKILKQVDLILYDSLVNPQIFDELDIDSSRLIFTGKRKGESYKQEEINQLILELLQAGKTIARLKGGNPLIFARGIEEAIVSQEAGYPIEFVPGLTSGLALPALYGITLTLRNKSKSVLLATGHELEKEEITNWIELIKNGGTLVLYMALSNIVEITKNLEQELKETIDLVAIENGSLENSKIINSNTSSITQDLINHSVKSPVIFIIGKHVNMCGICKSGLVNRVEEPTALMK